MAKNPAAPFAQTPGRIKARTTAAHVTLDDLADDLVLGFTAGSEGAVVTRLQVMPKETVTAGVAYCYRASSAGGAVDLLEVAAVAAVTVSTSSAGVPTSFSPTEELPWRLAAGECLYFGFSLAKVMTFSGDAVDF